MKIKTFLTALKHEINGFDFGDFVVFSDNSIYIARSDIEIKFSTPEEMVEYFVDGKSIGERIETVESIEFIINGGRGSSSSLKSFKFGHAPHEGKDNSVDDFPARMNINVKNPEKTLNEFRKKFANDKIEHAVIVDEMGYTHEFVHGNPSSVSHRPTKKGQMVYHNHPSGGAFSDTDLISAANGLGKGVVASGKNGDYIFVKSNGFKAKSFVKALKSATMKGKSYDDAVDKWLKKNQKSYGYKYEFKK